MVFLDLGPVFEEWEADVRRSYRWALIPVSPGQGVAYPIRGGETRLQGGAIRHNCQIDAQATDFVV
jgi:hypothetical protein